MKPYYQDDHITLYHADCLQHLDMLDQADVLITDPPYGMNYKSGHNKTKVQEKIQGDLDVKARDKVLEAWASEDRPALVFGTWRAPRPQCRNVIAWLKGSSPGMGDLSMPWGLSWEEIYVLGKGFEGRRVTNYINIPVEAAGALTRPDHPTPKPVPLMEELIRKCPETWTIIDPFAGSGSTLRAAKNLGRKAIGFEIEEKYCEIIAQRCAQETLGIF